MNRRQIVAAALLVLVTAGVLFSWRQFAKSRESRRELGRAQREYDALRNQVRRSNEVPRRGAPGAGNPSSVSQEPHPHPVSAPQKPPSREALTARDPKLRALFLELQLDPTRLGPRTRVLGLSAEQTDRLLALFQKNVSARLDLAAMADERGMPANDPEIERLDRELRQAVVAGLREVIGTTQFKGKTTIGAQGMRWENFGLEAPLQKFADSISRKVYLEDTPLTFEQGRQLVDIFAAHVEKDKTGSPYYAAVRAEKINWDAIIADARRGGFTAAQIEGLGYLAEISRTRRGMNEMTERALNRFPPAQRPTLNLPWPDLPRRKY